MEPVSKDYRTRRNFCPQSAFEASHAAKSGLRWKQVGTQGGIGRLYGSGCLCGSVENHNAGRLTTTYFTIDVHVAVHHQDVRSWLIDYASEEGLLAIEIRIEKWLTERYQIVRSHCSLLIPIAILVCNISLSFIPVSNIYLDFLFFLVNQRRAFSSS